MYVDGNNKTILVTMGHTYKIREPRVSYDDKKILFTTFEIGGHSDLNIININGTDFKKLKSSIVGGVSPQFQPR